MQDIPWWVALARHHSHAAPCPLLEDSLERLNVKINQRARLLTWTLALSLATLLAGPVRAQPAEPTPPASSAASPPPSRLDRMIDPQPPGATVWPPEAVATPKSDCSAALTGTNKTFNVGPGQTLEELTQVPWLSLQAGDVVNVFHRATPYRTKFGLRAQGTQDAPVVINGVTDASCNRPEINGKDAVTADDIAQARFLSKQHSENLGLIFIYQSSRDAWGYRPRNIVIQNLKLTGAHKSNQYTAQDGTRGTYSLGAAAIYAVRVEGLTVQNNEITDNGNGVFVNSRGNDDYSAFITIRRNRLHGNGNVGSYTEHNLYVQAARPLYEGNHVGQLRKGALGSSMKDRSSGSVIRYNHIVAAARAIDLVEIEGGVAPVLNDPLYDHAWVYGNLIVSDHDLPATSSSLLIHWGGDNDPRYFRKGTLHFYNNTVVTKATQAQAYYLCIFDMPTADQKVEAAANIFFHRGTSLLNLAYKFGTVVLRDTNWITKGWAKGWDPAVALQGAISKVVDGGEKGLSSSFVPLAKSVAVDGGSLSSAGFPPSVTAANLAPRFQFAAPAGMVERTVRGAGVDLGAFESP
jgi:hypothetical protein